MAKVGILFRLLGRAKRAANDQGLISRARASVNDFMDQTSPGMTRTDIYPERLFTFPNEVNVNRTRQSPLHNHNWNLAPDEQEALDALPLLERARFLRDAGESDALSPYEKLLLRRSDPKDQARFAWGLHEDDPVLRAILLGAGAGGLGMFGAREA